MRVLLSGLICFLGCLGCESKAASYANNLPIKLKVNGTIVLSSQQSAELEFSSRYPLLTFQSMHNTSVEFSISAGGGIESFSIPRGSPMLLPYSKNLSGNAIRVINKSVHSSLLKVGYFDFSAKSTYSLLSTGTKISLSQYESIMGRTLARSSQLFIFCSQPSLLALMTSDSSLEFIAIKMSEDNSQEVYKHLNENIKYISNDHYNLSKNWLGSVLGVVNVSLTSTECQVSYYVG